MTMLALVLTALCFGDGARAADYSANLGFDWTAARATAGDAGSRANARFGVEMRWALATSLVFETGTDYVFRRVNWRRADDRLVHVDFDYIDVPATVRVRVAPWVQILGGLRLGINVSDKPEIKPPAPAFDPGAHAMIVLGEAGLRFDLTSAWALDAVFEREFGDFARDLREYQTESLRIVYLF